jgi:hypothetical protein
MFYLGYLGTAMSGLVDSERLHDFDPLHRAVWTFATPLITNLASGIYEYSKYLKRHFERSCGGER